eukprot:1164997-Pyramimonas_sp.AAC.3
MQVPTYDVSTIGTGDDCLASCLNTLYRRLSVSLHELRDGQVVVRAVALHEPLKVRLTCLLYTSDAADDTPC